MKHTARLVEHHRIDVLHAHNLFPLLSPSVLRAGRAAGAAVVVTLHNYRLLCLPATFLRDGTACESCLGRLPWRGALYRCYRESFIGSTVLATSIGLHRGLQTFNAVHRFIAVSDFVRRKHVEGGLPAERISVKANFSWPMEPRSGPGEYFLYIGRLSKEKGVELLMRAWSRGNPPGRLVIVGDGPEAASLRRNAPTSVEFRGQVPSDQVPAILGGARALLLPSACYEAAPKTIVEAYAAGVPVVASDIGAIPDSVRSDVTGYLAPSGDADAWVALATRLMDDGECQRLGRGARALWAERHSPERVLVQLEDIYADALLARAQV